MKIQVRREPFLKGCRLADRVFPPRVVEPSFGRLLLRAQDSCCTLYAVGSDVALRLEIPAVVAEAGEAVLPARHALAVAREADSEELLLESGDGLVRAQGQDAEFLLETPGPVRHTATASAPEGCCHLLPADLLCQAIERALFAVGTRTARYSLQALAWEVEPDQVRLIGTDNKRLAVAEVPAQALDEQAVVSERLVHARAMDLLARMAQGQQEPIRALFGPKHILFQAGPCTLFTRPIEGAFPNWRKAIPPRPPDLFPLPVGPFLAGVRQAAVLREKTDARLRLRFEPGWVQMRSQQKGAGQTRIRLPLPLAGGRAEIALDPRLLLELLRVFEPQNTLLLGLTDQDTPALFSDGDSYTHVIMPLRSM